jgi:hypothetical protein
VEPKENFMPSLNIHNTIPYQFLEFPDKFLVLLSLFYDNVPSRSLSFMIILSLLPRPLPFSPGCTKAPGSRTKEKINNSWQRWDLNTSLATEIPMPNHHATTSIVNNFGIILFIL